MEREGYLLFSLVVFVGVLSLHLSRTEAAIGLPPDAKYLTRKYYKKLNTCANAEAFVKHQVQVYWNKDHSITAKLVKLLYADCMVNVGSFPHLNAFISSFDKLQFCFLF